MCLDLTRDDVIIQNIPRDLVADSTSTALCFSAVLFDMACGLASYDFQAEGDC